MNPILPLWGANVLALGSTVWPGGEGEKDAIPVHREMAGIASRACQAWALLTDGSLETSLRLMVSPSSW
jgi:hypothetical protein